MSQLIPMYWVENIFASQKLEEIRAGLARATIPRLADVAPSRVLATPETQFHEIISDGECFSV
jgi:hypothetical protein